MARPLVIAHRGASGERPEHTRSAYERAIDQGCDFIEPDLVMSGDGELIVRHENEIGGTTDVADRAEFADRRRTGWIDGLAVEGWFTEDFTLAELKTLRCRERLPDLRPANTAFDGQEPILTFQEVLAIAAKGSRRSGRVVGVCPELKHPSHFAALGLEMTAPFVAALGEHGLTGADAPLMVQCFEPSTLKTLRPLIAAPLLQLIQRDGGPADGSAPSFAAMTAPAGLSDIATYADWIGVETSLVCSDPERPPTALVDHAHAAGLSVAVWTLRAENAFLPPSLRRGADPATHGDLGSWLRRFGDLGVDAVFTDFPARV